MRSPEEFAWEVLASDDFVLTPHEVLTDLIRARDAEVAEAARAESARLREGTDGHGHIRGMCMASAPDVDPDEALARVLWDAFWTGTDCDAKWEVNDERPDWLRVARAVREHIEAEGGTDE